MKLPEKAPVVGTGISMTTYDEVLEAVEKRSPDEALTIAVCTVHSVMSARRDDALRSALGSASIATPDGMPLVWTLKYTENSNQARVYGPDLMRRALLASAEYGWKHYLYGSTPETLERLLTSISEMAPDAQIVGSYSPPFAPPSPEQDAADVERLRASGADIVWVGLGMPKQELWMHRMADDLPGMALIGVGAAFDFIAGTVEEAPGWMMRSGLEWLYRLSKEPRRLWRRYIWNNPKFIMLVTWQLVTFRLARVRKPADKTSQNDA